jgi:RNA polymerase sigma factor (sigma-70 family)
VVYFFGEALGQLMYQDESALIQDCLNGSQPAWNKLVERYSRLVYSVPRHYGLPTEDAEEVFQNVFVIVFRHLAKLRKHQALAGWLITIARRESMLVGRKSRPHLELNDDIEDSQPLSHELVQRWERQHYLREALRQLGSPCRELLTILFLEDPLPSYGEIAKRLGMAEGSIGPKRARCLKKLEAILSAMGVDLSS